MRLRELHSLVIYACMNLSNPKTLAPTIAQPLLQPNIILLPSVVNPPPLLLVVFSDSLSSCVVSKTERESYMPICQAMAVVSTRCRWNCDRNAGR